MYSETVRPDKKDLTAAIILIFLCIAVILLIRYLIRNILLCDIITFALIGFTVYNTITGCCSEFTYSVNNESILLSRKTSSINKHTVINKSDIIGIYLNKPKKFRASADSYKTFSDSGKCFIIYKDGGAEKNAVFTASDTFVENMSAFGYQVT